MTQLKALVAAAALAMAGPIHAQDSTDTRPTVAVMYFTDGRESSNIINVFNYTSTPLNKAIIKRNGNSSVLIKFTSCQQYRISNNNAFFFSIGI